MLPSGVDVLPVDVVVGIDVVVGADELVKKLVIDVSHDVVALPSEVDVLPVDDVEAGVVVGAEDVVGSVVV